MDILDVFNLPVVRATYLPAALMLLLVLAVFGRYFERSPDKSRCRSCGCGKFHVLRYNDIAGTETRQCDECRSVWTVSTE